MLAETLTFGESTMMQIIILTEAFLSGDKVLRYLKYSLVNAILNWFQLQVYRY